MSDIKPLASLSSTLLARKGQASPAMRRQALQMGDVAPQNLEDLGWNDMGHDGAAAHPAASEPIPFPAPVDQPQLASPLEQVPAPPVVEQQEQLMREFDMSPEHEPAPAISNASGLTPMEGRRPSMTRAAPGSKAKSAFTLRLDQQRHLQLRLVCAMKHRSAQQVVTEALDEFLARQPEVADFHRNQR